MKTAFRLSRIVAMCSAIAMTMLPPAPTGAADLNTEIDSLFNSLGAMGNYTSPGAFRGQTYNTYTGGSLFLRSPNKVYQLATLQFPYAKAGCGGIDVFGGSFSHLSSAEFKNVLKSVTAALPGVAFQLALSAVSPLLGQKAEWAKSLETFINNARINSCETATALVRGAANEMGFSEFSACVRIALATGLATDEDDARNQCRTNQSGIMTAARGGSDPDAKAIAPFVGNLVWQALKRVDHVDDQEREIIMSMTGTVIYSAPDNSGHTPDPDVRPATLTSIKQLLYGQADAGPGLVQGHLLKCGDYTGCTSVSDDTSSTFKPFTTKVEETMRSLSDKIATRSGAPSSSEIGFVNVTGEPVYRMLSVGNAIKGSGLADTLILKYRDVIAVDYAYNFLERYLRIGLTALEKDYHLQDIQRKDAREIRDRIRGYLAEIARERQVQYTKVAAFSSVADDLEKLERQMRSHMPQQVLDMLGQNGLGLAAR